MSTFNIELTADDQLALKFALAAIHGAMTTGITWAEMNENQDEENPRADHDQGDRLLTMHRATRGLPKSNLVLSLSRQEAEDIYYAITWVEGQLAYSPLWEFGNQPGPSADWDQAELIIEEGKLAAKLAELLGEKQ